MLKKTLGVSWATLSCALTVMAGSEGTPSTWQVLESAPVVQAYSQQDRDELKKSCDALDMVSATLHADGQAYLKKVFEEHPRGHEILKTIAQADAFGLIIQCVPLKMQDSADEGTEEVDESVSLDEDELDDEL